MWINKHHAALWDFPVSWCPLLGEAFYRWVCPALAVGEKWSKRWHKQLRRCCHPAVMRQPTSNTSSLPVHHPSSLWLWSGLCRQLLSSHPVRGEVLTTTALRAAWVSPRLPSIQSSNIPYKGPIKLFLKQLNGEMLA